MGQFNRRDFLKGAVVSVIGSVTACSPNLPPLEELAVEVATLIEDKKPGQYSNGTVKIETLTNYLSDLLEKQVVIEDKKFKVYLILSDSYSTESLIEVPLSELKDVNKYLITIFNLDSDKPTLMGFDVIRNGEYTYDYYKPFVSNNYTRGVHPQFTERPVMCLLYADLSGRFNKDIEGLIAGRRNNDLSRDEVVTEAVSSKILNNIKESLGAHKWWVNRFD